MVPKSIKVRSGFTLWRLKRAVVNRLDPRTALRCALQTERCSVRHTGIGNVPGWEEDYASLAHFRYGIPAVLPRRSFNCRVAQSFLDADFAADTRPKVFFTREPTPLLGEETRRNVQREDLVPFLLRFDDENIARRQFYVVLPDRRGHILRRLRGSIDERRPRLACIVNRYKQDDRLPLTRERLRFVDAMGEDIDIYGEPPRGPPNPWDRYANYRGAARDKIRTLRRYTFNLCFENCDEDGYVTEKIVDALAAGCVPLYQGGGRFLQETVPGDCFIDCRGQNPGAIHERVRTMGHDEVLRYRQAGLDFLESSRADRFTRRYWADRVIEQLQSQF